jgi:glutamyl-tRNA synthetase
VGGARTAYFNWLFARQQGGAFVLRIEDTDVARSSESSESGVLDDLRWLGLEWDEGPDVGGPHGPYRQSERTGLYRAAADQLLASGKAYPCFCTDEELEARRAAALAAGRPPHYDGHCRHYSEAQRAEARAQGRPESVRFHVEARDGVLEDLVKGEVRFPAGMVGDFVVMRASGLPTYNFACVVDDAGMRFSHVIRAEEHLSNTARQLMLYAALALPQPRFAHVPLILNSDRSKMSKRSGEAAVAVGDYRRAGFVPEALLSYLALLGFHPGDEREILSRAELLADFTLARVGKSGAVFDADKLRWVNSQVLHHASGEQLRGWGEPFLPVAARALAPERLTPLLEAIRGNLATLADLPAELAPMLDPSAATEPEAAAALDSESARSLCADVADRLLALAEWNVETVKSAIQSAGQAAGKKGRELFQPVRAALTGRTHGPELPRIIEWLGRDSAAERLKAAARGRSS